MPCCPSPATRLLLQPYGGFLYRHDLRRYEVINATAAMLLRGLAAHADVERAIASIAEAFGIDSESVSPDVLGLVDRWRGDGYLEEVAAWSRAAGQAGSSDHLSRPHLLDDFAAPSELKLVHVVAELTNRCNGACPYCYACANDLPAQGELPPGEWRTILDRLHARGLRVVVLSGGEPLLRGDALPLLEWAADRFIVELNTNGAAIDEAAARRIALARPRHVQVSIDSIDEAENDRLRYRGALAGARRGVALLRRAGVEVVIAATRTSQTDDSLGALAAWAAEMGCRLKIARLRRTGRGADASPTARLSAPPTPSLAPGDAPALVPCPTMLGYAAIAPDGRLKACTMPPTFFDRLPGGMSADRADVVDFADSRPGRAAGRATLAWEERGQAAFATGICRMAPFLAATAG